MPLTIEIKQLKDVDKDEFNYIKPIIDEIMKEFPPDSYYYENCCFEYKIGEFLFFVMLDTFHYQTLELEGDFKGILVVLFVLAAYFPQIKLSVNDINKSLIDDIIEYVMVFGIGVEFGNPPIDKEGFLNLRIIHIDKEIPKNMIKS